MFAAYLVLFSWLVTKVKFFTKSGITAPQLIILFLLKVMAGIFYGWIGVFYGEMAQMIDTWAYHQESLNEYALLRKDPIEFFTSLFQNNYGGYGKFLSTENSWWNDVKANFLIKIMAVFNLFSFGNYYVNVIFYSFLTFFGPIALYRVMRSVFPDARMPVLIACFLVPSFLYWTSGLHKEGLIFTCLAMICYQVYFSFQRKRIRMTGILIILVSLACLLILRNFLILLLVPPLFSWVLSQRFRSRSVLIFTGVTILFLAMFFVAPQLDPRLDFADATVHRQGEFLQLGGGSAVEVKRLEPTARSFAALAPQAFALSTIRPYPSDVKHLLSLAASVEINFLLAFFLLFLFFRKKEHLPTTPFLLFCIFFSFGVLMMIGYTVNILGAIVRYRSIVFPLLVVPMAARMDWARLTRIANTYISKGNNM